MENSTAEVPDGAGSLTFVEWSFESETDFSEKGEYELRDSDNTYGHSSSAASRDWERVQQRIVPTDRQNLGQILKTNGLQEYDEFKLLMLANGRCAQDSLYLERRDTKIISQLYKKRFERRVDMVIPLGSNQLLVGFKNGVVKKCVINLLVGDNRLFRQVLISKELFQKVTVQTGGYGICWGERVMISDTELYEKPHCI